MDIQVYLLEKYRGGDGYLTPEKPFRFVKDHRRWKSVLKSGHKRRLIRGKEAGAIGRHEQPTRGLIVTPEPPAQGTPHWAHPLRKRTRRAPSSTKNQQKKPRPGDASDEEGQSVVFRDEGSYRGRCRLGAGAHGHGHRRQRGRTSPETAALLHGQEEDVFGDAGYTGANKRPELEKLRRISGTSRSSAASSRLCRQALRDLAEPVERALSQVRAVVEHPFHIVKNRFHHKKLRYRGLTKNTAQLHTLFAVANLVMVKKALLLPSSA